MSFPATEIFDRLQAWANRFPDRPAHVAASAGRTATTALTYRQLLAQTRAVAAHLRRQLPDDGSPVIVLGHKEPEMLAGFLGVVGSGHPYIPLDDSLPAHRIASVTAVSGATLTLTPETVATLPPADYTELTPPRAAAPFYIIFTSGSTGEPKGVVITTACLDAFLDWTLAEHPFVEGGETFLNQAPFSFDLSVMDLYLSLATGGTLYSITRREIADFKSLFRAFDTAGLTAWVSTPSFAQLCLVERTFAAARLPAMRHFLFCGETLSADTAGRLLERFPAAEVWNTYGPTEATVATTSIRISPEIVARGNPLPIGYPRPGTRMYLRDDYGSVAAPGERGEMVIAGPNVSPGYLGRPDLTEAVFFEEADGQQAYRTGDWGRWRDGSLYFEGRQDSQIKLHGYRIELADIEENLVALDGVRDCAVVPVSRHGTVQFLAAFVVPTRTDLDDAMTAATVDILRSQLARRLPAYMVPRKIYFQPLLPMTANGKADRRQLSELAANGGVANKP